MSSDTTIFCVFSLTTNCSDYRYFKYADLHALLFSCHSAIYLATASLSYCPSLWDAAGAVSEGMETMRCLKEM